MSFKFSDVEYDRNLIYSWIYDNRFIAIALTPLGPGRGGSASRRWFYWFIVTKPSDCCNNIWICNTAGVNHRYGCMTACSGPSEQNFLNASQAFSTIWHSIPVSALFTAFRVTVPFFTPMCSLFNSLHVNRAVNRTLSATSFYTASALLPEYCRPPAARTTYR